MVNSQAISRLVEYYRKEGLDMHSLLVARSGVLVSETYWKPFGKDSMQRMYSCTKSLTAMAVLMLSHDGRLSLDDPIVRYFPEYVQGPVDPRLEATTIRDMLKMESCFRTTCYKRSQDPSWTRTFFTVEPDHEPGSFFSYDTGSYQVLASLVEKLSGQSLVSFLHDHLLHTYGFSEDAYCLKNAAGEAMGGSGLMAHSRDLLVVLQALTDPACPYHKEFREAVSKQVETSPGAAGGLLDLNQGYGYGFWRLSHDGWCMYGMGGQMAIYLPKQKLAVATTAWVKPVSGGLQTLFNGIWDILLPSLKDEPLAEEPPLPLKPELPFAKGKRPGTDWNGNWRMTSRTLGFDSLAVKTDASKLTISFKTGTQTYVLEAGLGKNLVGPSVFHDGWTSATSAAVDSDGNLQVHCRFLTPEVGLLALTLAKRGNRLSVRVQSWIEPKLPLANGSSSAIVQG